MSRVDNLTPPDFMDDGPPLGHEDDCVAPVGIASDPPIHWPVMVGKGDKRRVSTKHIENTQALMKAYGIKVRYNLMRHRMEIAIDGLQVDEETRENKSIEALVALAERRGLARVQTLSHVQILAESYHPVWDWISATPWDGTDRLADLLKTVTLQPHGDTGLAGLLLLRWLVACVRAVMPSKPGESFRPQGVLTLQGSQGLGKSRWLESLAPRGSGWVLPGATLDPHDRDSVSQLTSVWIVELGELDGTLDRAHIAAVKAFVDRPADTYRRPYARSDETVPRKTMMAASVNPRMFLADETGSRRWWSIPVVSVNADHGIDMQQLWAQIRTHVEAGERWWLDRDEQARLTAANLQHTITDPLVEDLWKHYEPSTMDNTGVGIPEIYAQLREGKRTWHEVRKLTLALDPFRTGKIVRGFPTFAVAKRSQ
jgi:putative DNA primase/helicase